MRASLFLPHHSLSHTLPLSLNLKDFIKRKNNTNSILFPFSLFKNETRIGYTDVTKHHSNCQHIKCTEMYTVTKQKKEIKILFNSNGIGYKVPSMPHSLLPMPLSLCASVLLGNLWIKGGKSHFVWALKTKKCL